MSDFFDYSHVVAPDEIDAQGHVHNLRYLQWTLWAAGSHSRAGGWDSKKALEQKLGWVVRNHDITYRAAAMQAPNAEATSLTSMTVPIHVRDCRHAG